MLQRILGCAKFMLRVLKISDFRGISIPAGLWERKENVHLRPVAQTALFFFPEVVTYAGSCIYYSPEDKPPGCEKHPLQVSSHSARVEKYWRQLLLCPL